MSKEANEFRDMLLSAGNGHVTDYAKEMRGTFTASTIKRHPEGSPTSDATQGMLDYKYTTGREAEMFAPSPLRQTSPFK